MQVGKNEVSGLEKRVILFERHYNYRYSKAKEHCVEFKGQCLKLAVDHDPWMLRNYLSLSWAVLPYTSNENFSCSSYHTSGPSKRCFSSSSQYSSF